MGYSGSVISFREPNCIAIELQKCTVYSKDPAKHQGFIESFVERLKANGFTDFTVLPLKTSEEHDSFRGEHKIVPLPPERKLLWFFPLPI